ncbi:unnamed protein product [Effrenium voratum]|uniref:SSD domain-containing protein n=1 Tax=Effrenium voratum TaxID=2562239 RepID=A0AA36I169_9DINO|nr:unnamed protein product [Effrenium voratum]
MAGLAGALGYLTLMTRDDVWMILDGEMTQHRRAFSAAREEADPLVQTAGSGSTKQVQVDRERLFLFYKSDTAGVETLFTPDRLASICELEKTMVNNSLVEDVTLMDSVLGLFYGTAANPALQSIPAARTLASYDWGCQKLADADVDDVVEKAYADMVAKGPQSLYARFVDPYFPQTKKSAYSRTFLQINVVPDQGEAVVQPAFDYLGLAYGFLKSALQGDEDRFVASGNIRVRLTYTGINEIQKMAIPDFMLSFMAVALVFIIVWLHTKSSFLAATSLFMMIMSLPMAALIYQGVFRVLYFEFLHILVVYLVLGIGADDIFVFKDTFCHIVKAEYPFLAGGRLSEDQEIKVLSLTYQRAGVAIFNTSFTTAAAFTSASVSKAMPMRTCGWFAATCIIMVYVLTLTYFPPLLLMWHRRLQSKRCFCPSLTERETSVVPTQGDKVKEEPMGFVETFFEKLYIPVMSKKVGQVRIFALMIFVILLVVAIQGVAFALQLTPPRSEEVWFPSNHMLLSLQDFMADNFYTPAFENYGVVTVFFGISGLDRAGIDVYNPGAFTGTAIYDSGFDLTTQEAQTALLGICSKVHNITCEMEGCDNAGYNSLMMQTTERTDACFLEDFKHWMNGTLPTGTLFTEKLLEFRRSANKGDYYGDLMGPTVNYEKDIGFVDGELKYVALHFRSAMKKRLPFSLGTAIRDHIRQWMIEQRGSLPASLQSMKFHGNGEFQRYDMGEELINGLFSGVAIAMPISFLVLLCSTQNVVVAIYAVISVAFIVMCVLGFCKSAMDWDLGVGEAIAGVIVIGYSVDYVVHLAHMYCESSHFGHYTRDARAKFAIRNMGSTIFAGALTTMLAGATMFICWFSFFIKMAILICVTIMYSFLFSLLFFMSLLWLAGPEDNFGTIPMDKLLHRPEAKVDASIMNDTPQEVNYASPSKDGKEGDLKAEEIDEGTRSAPVPTMKA